MYFLPQLRGQGVGERLLMQCLQTARELGFATCYLETLTGMKAARRLYAGSGSRRSPGRWATPATSAATPTTR